MGINPNMPSKPDDAPLHSRKDFFFWKTKGNGRETAHYLRPTSSPAIVLILKINFAIGHHDFVVLAVEHRTNSFLGETLHKHGNLPVDTASIKIMYTC